MHISNTDVTSRMLSSDHVCLLSQVSGSVEEFPHAGKSAQTIRVALIFFLQFTWNISQLKKDH